jgi:hypothetical protein
MKQVSSIISDQEIRFRAERQREKLRVGYVAWHFRRHDIVDLEAISIRKQRSDDRYNLVIRLSMLFTNARQQQNGEQFIKRCM